MVIMANSFIIGHLQNWKFRRETGFSSDRKFDVSYRKEIGQDPIVGRKEIVND